MTSTESLDVVIVGAGISGINTAHYLQTRGPEGYTYTILEGRPRLGGTWDLFQYPGIRSDSDIFTFGFSWNPWPGDNPIASGDKICSYLSQSAAISGIDKKIRFNHKVQNADWSSEKSRWLLRVGTPDGGSKKISAKFLVLSTGYYHYDQPLKTIIPGIERFQGQVIKPQHWSKDVQYTNKNVVIIGSGATAITLLPNMAEDARHVTMLQRSPSYIFSLKSKQGLLTKAIRRFLPRWISGIFMRWQFILLANFMYFFCQWLPGRAKKVIKAAAREQLPPNYDLDTHFKPRYNPWDQRLCLCPDGDFFDAIRSTKASITTDTINTVTESSIQLQSGQELKPDIIVAATGLQLRFAGGIELTVDGKPLNAPSKYAFKGAMVQDAPNLAFVLGYANASWTLGAEATGVFLTRLWNTMEKKGIKAVIPRADSEETGKWKPRPPLDLNSTYIKEGQKDMPRGGEGMWAPRRNYIKDIYLATWPNILQGLETR